MSNHWQRLTTFWFYDGITIRAGVDLSEIQAFESKFAVRLPDDMREYFLAVDGMKELPLDPAQNRFWPLAMVKPLSEDLGELHPNCLAYPGCFLFVDHCFWSYAWGVELRNEPSALSGPVLKIIGGDDPVQQIAPSFTAFMEMYLQSPYSIL